jgi:hypothetical protein
MNIPSNVIPISFRITSQSPISSSSDINLSIIVSSLYTINSTSSNEVSLKNSTKISTSSNSIHFSNELTYLQV